MNHRTRLALGASSLAVVVTLAACTADPAATPMATATAAPMSEAPGDSPRPTTAVTPTASGAASPSPSATATEAPDDPLLTAELTDVRTGEKFTLAELAAEEGPILLEPMAVWCTSCLAQQREVVQAHELGEFTSVSLDVELTEDPSDLAAYAEREGFDWRFAMADAALYRLLQERFKPAATHPPSTPLIVIEADGTVRPLEFGVGIRSADELLAELGA